MRVVAGMPAIGIDVGGSFIKGVRLSRTDQVEMETARPLPSGNDAVFETVCEMVMELGGSQVSGVGVGLAGLVRWPEGEFVWGPHVDGQAVPFRMMLEDRLGFAAVVDNDANLAALAEHRLGAARGVAHALMVTLGTGIGGGLIIDGRNYRGAGFAGEIGHMTMFPGGEPCDCGQRGCWETLVSGARLDRLARQVLDRSTATGADLSAAAVAGNEEARTVLAEAGVWLGRGVANLVVVLDPEVVVVGGAAAGAGRWLFDPARKVLAEELEGVAFRKALRLVPAELGAIAAAIGAALTAREWVR
jgi:glucokinase